MRHPSSGMASYLRRVISHVTRVKRLWAIGVSAATAAFAFGVSALPVHAYPANGTFEGQTNFTVQCSSAIGVGVAFDGTFLWYTCFNSGTSPDLLRADPKTGLVTYSTNIQGGLGAIAFDVTRNAIWGSPGGPHPDAIWLISLNASHTAVSYTHLTLPTKA